MINLLQETLDELKANGKTPDDVRWVGTDDAYFDWQQFTSWGNFSYSNDFGKTEIDLELVVVGDDWWLERSEWGGAEAWHYKTLPTRPKRRWVTSPIRAMTFRFDELEANTVVDGHDDTKQ